MDAAEMEKVLTRGMKECRGLLKRLRDEHSTNQESPEEMEESTSSTAQLLAEKMSVLERNVGVLLKTHRCSLAPPTPTSTHFLCILRKVVALATESTETVAIATQELEEERRENDSLSAPSITHSQHIRFKQRLSSANHTSVPTHI